MRRFDGRRPNSSEKRPTLPTCAAGCSIGSPEVASRTLVLRGGRGCRGVAGTASASVQRSGRSMLLPCD